MAPVKTLVIGSTKHQHAKCIDWNDVSSVNIVDFDAVVINTHSLCPVLIRNLYMNSHNIRTSLARLWGSGGDIVVLGAPLIPVEISRTIPTNNYYWSPISIEIVAESGDTIERLLLSSLFTNYLSSLKRWAFYYHLPVNCFTSETMEI